MPTAVEDLGPATFSLAPAPDWDGGEDDDDDDELPPLSTMIPTTHQVRGRVTATRRLLQRHQSVLPIHLLALLRRQAVIMRLLQFLPPVRHVNTVRGRGRGLGRRSAIDII